MGGVFAQLSDVADHLDYLREVAGEDHIGIGSDFWGSADMPEGPEDPSRFPHLFAELLRRGWSEVALRKLAGENFLRTFRAAEKVAQELQQTRKTLGFAVSGIVCMRTLVTLLVLLCAHVCCHVCAAKKTALPPGAWQQFGFASVGRSSGGRRPSPDYLGLMGAGAVEPVVANVNCVSWQRGFGCGSTLLRRCSGASRLSRFHQ